MRPSFRALGARVFEGSFLKYTVGAASVLKLPFTITFCMLDRHGHLSKVKECQDRSTGEKSPSPVALEPVVKLNQDEANDNYRTQGRCYVYRNSLA
jgi:hypothetical protein